VLSSLKLAAEFLVKGGTFVTKVFRSQDYNNLLWVFGQLFGKVEATKPPSSRWAFDFMYYHCSCFIDRSILHRNVSAEIFVVCTGFLAPQFIDPKFLDPKHVFKEVSALPPPPVTANPTSGTPVTTLTPAATNVLQPGKKRRHRDGYADGDYTLFHTANAFDFIRTYDPVTFLGTFNRIEFRSDEEKEWLAREATTSEIRANCEDLKVLGKGDFKALLRWRTALREEVPFKLCSRLVGGRSTHGFVS
jgi:AdoMet-dependent rRNA methyltransferase SPB1